MASACSSSGAAAEAVRVAATVAVDADGVIWLTALPGILRYFAALDGEGPSADAGAATRSASARYKAVQVFADDGAMLSAGNAVARWRVQILIGARFDKKVLICKTPP